MQVEWYDRCVEVEGDWPARWLFLAPDYELYVDGECVDRAGGPIIRPRLAATLDRDDRQHRVECEILSIAGLHPRCELSVDGESIKTGRVSMRNILNPILALIILISTGIMLYLGPTVLRAYLPIGG